MKEGEIYSFVKPTGNKAESRRHPFAVVEITEDGDAICCMLTHSNGSKFPYNKGMRPEHFREHYPALDITPFQFEPTRPTYFSAVILLKPTEYFANNMTRKSGMLTEEGLKFLRAESKKGVEPMYWGEYFNRFVSQ